MTLEDCFILTRNELVPNSTFFSETGADLSASRDYLRDKAKMFNLQNAPRYNGSKSTQGPIRTRTEIINSANPKPAQFYIYRLNFGLDVIVPCAISDNSIIVSSQTLGLETAFKSQEFYFDESKDQTKSVGRFMQKQALVINKWLQDQDKKSALRIENTKHEHSINGFDFEYSISERKIDGRIIRTEKRFSCTGQRTLTNQENSHILAYQVSFELEPPSKDISVNRFTLEYLFSGSESENISLNIDFEIMGGITTLVIINDLSITAHGVKIRFDEKGEMIDASGTLIPKQLKNLGNYTENMNITGLLNEIACLNPNSFEPPFEVAKYVNQIKK